METSNIFLFPVFIFINVFVQLQASILYIYVYLCVCTIWNCLFLLPDVSLMDDPGEVITLQYNLLGSVYFFLRLYSFQLHVLLPYILDQNTLYNYLVWRNKSKKCNITHWTLQFSQNTSFHCFHSCARPWNQVIIEVQILIRN